jgi:predicted nucleic acid-binding protein
MTVGRCQCGGEVVLPERGAEAVRAMLWKAEKLIAPALIRVEVAAAVTRKVRLGELQADEAEETCRLWVSGLRRGVVTLNRDEESLDEAIDLALEIQHPLQDCLYLALARRVEGTLITADPKFAKRVAGVYSRVERLDND